VKRACPKLILLWPCIWIATTTCVEANAVPAGYRDIADRYDIPPKVLYAVALQESGKKLSDGAFRPWPWTLNVEGKPKRYETRRAAWRALKRYIRQGKVLIDIGLMQVNWHYHKNKLGTLWRALEPYHNMRVAADILKSQYRKRKDWLRAIGAYHSPGSKKRQRKNAERYRRRVAQHMASLNEGTKR
jgi:Transglycosylase SLT domain